MNFETAKEIEIAVAHWFGIRRNLIVPNVSWGMLAYECDMMVLLPSGYCAEVEIKVSKSDLLADQKKNHQHDSKLMRYLYFAIPQKLEHSIEHIPERAGVLVVRPKLPTEYGAYEWKINLVREAKVNPLARKLDDGEKFTLARLGALRIWGLKSSLVTAREQLKANQKGSAINDKVEM